MYPLNDNLKFSFVIVLAAAIVLLDVFPVSASSSVNVPLDSSVYRDIEILASRGLIKSGLFSTGPFSRTEVGRLLYEAMDSLETKELPAKSSSEIIMNRLMADYEDEVAEMQTGFSPGTIIRLRDSFSIRYNYLNGPFSVYNNEGVDYFDGNNAQFEFRSYGKLWNVFSFYIQPVFLYNQHFGNIDGNDETEARLHRGYIKLTLSNFEIQVGRDSLWWGPAYHGSLLMSNNAHPFDMIKLSNPKATLLPWIFRYLGPFKFNLIFSELEDERTSSAVSNPYLYGLRLDFKPHPYFEVGLSQLCLFAGEGRRSLSFVDVVKILYSNKNRDGTKLESNQQVAIDFALTVPGVRRLVPVAESVKLYWEWGAEDTGTPPDKRGYIVGAAFYDFLMRDDMIFRAEYANLNPSSVPGAWYTHSSYPMQYDGRIFGHHAGSAAEDLFFELSQDRIGRFSYQIGFDKERSGLDVRANVQEKYQVYVGIGYELTEKSKIAVRYGYEKIRNYNNVADDDRNNHFIGTEFQVGF